MKRILAAAILTLAMANLACAADLSTKEVNGLTVHSITQGDKIVRVAVNKAGQVVYYVTDTKDKAPVAVTWVRKAE